MRLMSRVHVEIARRTVARRHIDFVYDNYLPSITWHHNPRSVSLREHMVPIASDTPPAKLDTCASPFREARDY